jgi:hypothetical protein
MGLCFYGYVPMNKQMFTCNIDLDTTALCYYGYVQMNKQMFTYISVLWGLCQGYVQTNKGMFILRQVNCTPATMYHPLTMSDTFWEQAEQKRQTQQQKQQQQQQKQIPMQRCARLFKVPTQGFE